MKKMPLLIGGLMLALGLSAHSQTNQLYLDGSLGIAEADAGALDTDDTFFRIGAGVTLTEQFSAEAGFWDFGSSQDRGVRVSADALYGALKASTDIGNNLNLYGRLGLLRWDADIGDIDDDGHDLFFGGGINFQAGPGRVGVEIHFADLDRVDLRTIGVSYSLPLDI